MAVDDESPKKFGQWPEVTLIRRSDAETIHHVPQLEPSAKPDDLGPQVDNRAADNNVSNLPQMDGSVTMNVSPEAVRAVADGKESQINPPGPVLVVPAADGAETGAAAEAATEKHDAAVDELPPYSESDSDDVEGDTDAIEEVPSQDSESEREEDEINVDDYDLGNVTSHDRSKVSNPLSKSKSHVSDHDKAADSDLSEDEDVDDVEEILSGNLDVPGVKVREPTI